MANSKLSPTIPAGKAINDTQGSDAAKAPIDNRVQVHQGNIPVLTVHFLSRIAEAVEKIAKAMEQDV